MILVLAIRVLDDMPIIEFNDIRVFSNTLEVTAHPSGRGYQIKILDSHGEERIWFAVEIYTIKFMPA
jgi:hypothetical protein